MLTPYIQNKLLKAAGRMPVTLLFTGPNAPAKTLAAEVLAAHYELYLFRVDLPPLLCANRDETQKNLARIFARVQPAGDLLFFEGADALLAPGAADDALPCFLPLLQRFRGVVILSMAGGHPLPPSLAEILQASIAFGTGKEAASW